MKVQTSTITGAALDWAVAKCECEDKELSRLRVHNGRVDFLWDGGNPHGPRRSTDYSANWSQGGPIIERENISTCRIFCDGEPNSWVCNTHTLEYDERGEYIEGSDNAMEGPTPLIAAMRCYVASKLGDEVDVPEELL